MSKPTTSGTRPTKKTRRGGADANTARLGFIGAGKLATSIITGLLSVRGQVDPKRIYISSPTTTNTETMKKMKFSYYLGNLSNVHNDNCNCLELELTQAIDFTSPSDEHWMTTTNCIGIISPTITTTITIITRFNFGHTQTTR